MPLDRRETRDWLRPGGPICLRPHPTPHHTASPLETGHKRTGFIDQSQARATPQAPSIRVPHAGHAANYILLLSRVLLWLAAHLPRMPLPRRETRDWLRPGGPICLRPNLTPL
uniref:Uncharacterized protein n=1 Tax=Mesocestoides corti TaxID=53468 RepID=A0A5K3FX41_MESCO